MAWLLRSSDDALFLLRALSDGKLFVSLRLIPPAATVFWVQSNLKSWECYHADEYHNVDVTEELNGSLCQRGKRGPE